LRRALGARDRGCRFPGCTNTRFVDGHHIEHWGDGGETNLDNLISLCRRHHRYVHEQGCTVELDDEGEAHFRNQYGVASTERATIAPSDAAALPDQHGRLGSAIDSRTCRTGTGDRMDLGLAVGALIASRSAADRPRLSI